MDYIAKDNVVAALETDDRIVKATENLMMFPLMGRIGRVSGTRELVVAQSDFIVAYKLTEEDDNITILRILHGAQQWPEVSEWGAFHSWNAPFSATDESLGDKPKDGAVQAGTPPYSAARMAGHPPHGGGSANSLTKKR